MTWDKTDPLNFPINASKPMDVAGAYGPPSPSQQLKSQQQYGPGLYPVGGSLTGVPTPRFNREQIDLIRRTVGRGATDDEFKAFMHQAERTELDPLARQIYLIERGGKHKPEVSIDGFRLIAERTGKYAGQLGPYWCGPDNVWYDVWLAEERPAASKVGVLRSDFREPLWGTALYKSYAKQGGNLWRTMPEVMIAKCAEAAALRRAFPHELSGLYTSDEMEQADNTAGGSPSLIPAQDGATTSLPSPGHDAPSAPSLTLKTEPQAHPDKPEAVRRFHEIHEEVKKAQTLEDLDDIETRHQDDINFIRRPDHPKGWATSLYAMLNQRRELLNLDLPPHDQVII